MATSINSSQIRAGQVNRTELNIVTVGQSVIAKIIQGTYISITSTGADAGTGDVTLNVNVPLATTTVSGLMSAADKVYSNNMPTTYASSSNFSTIIPLATTTVAGLLSPTDKTTLANFGGAGYAPLNSPSFVGYPVAPLNILTTGNTSYSQTILLPASYANDTGSFATSVIICSLPNSYVTTTNTQFSIEVSGKDSITGFFNLVISAKLTSDGGTATSWVFANSTLLSGNAPFTTVNFAMSVATPKLPMIVFGDGTTGLSFPAYSIDKITILGPSANVLYNSGSVASVSMLAQASIATTYVVQTTTPLGMMAKIDSPSISSFVNGVDSPKGYSARGNYVLNTYNGGTAPSYSAGFGGENYGNGLLVNFGANFDQLALNSSPVIGPSVPTMFGSYFRIDTRDAQADQMFSVSAIPTGTGTSASREQKVFKVNRTGDLFSTTNAYAVATSNNFATVIPAVTTTVNGLMLTADKVTFNAIPTTYASASNFTTIIPVATTTVSGLMATADKVTFNAIPTTYASASNFTTILPVVTTTVAGLMSAADKVTFNAISTTYASASNFTTIIPVATTTVAGLLSGADKTTINSLATTYARTAAINSFVLGQTFASNILISNTATLLATQPSGTVQNAVNILYFSNGTANIPVSTFIPVGGTVGQVLQKASTTDYATSWLTVPGGNVTGPAASTSLGIATFNNLTGTLLSSPLLTVTATGALQTTGVGSGTIAGNARGTGAVDLQISRTAAAMVASGVSCTVLGGQNNTTSGLTSVISGGTGNSVLSDTSIIAGGRINTINTGATSSVIVGGDTNSIVASATWGYIGGGFTNIINNAAAIYSVIAGGKNNTNNAATATIGGGSGNTIGAGAYDSIVAGGSANFVASTSNGQVINGGSNHLINTSQGFNTITGGYSHTISGATGTSTINGGNGNQITQGTGAVIVGGSFNSSTSNYSLVQGYYGTATMYGQRAFSNNKFVNAGDAQFSLYNLMAATASITPVVMTLDGVATVSIANALTIAAAQSKYFFINITAQSTLASTITGLAVWEIKVLVARTTTAATLVVVGTPANVLLASSGTITGWAVSVGVDTTIGSLKLTVTTGAATTAVKWLATIDATELTF